MYSLKFQSVVIPNGLIANIHGPFEWERHDSARLQETDLLNDLKRVAWYNMEPVCVYRDSAYPLWDYTFKPYSETCNLYPKWFYITKKPWANFRNFLIKETQKSLFPVRSASCLYVALPIWLKLFDSFLEVNTKKLIFLKLTLFLATNWDLV